MGKELSKEELKKIDLKLDSLIKEAKKAEREAVEEFFSKKRRVEDNIFTDPYYFKIFLHVVNLEDSKRSNPMEITKGLKKFEEGTNITKTVEYKKIIRYLQRWEEAGIIKKSTEKVRHNKSFFTTDYNQILEHFLDLLEIKAFLYRAVVQEEREEISYQNNKYIIGFLKYWFNHLGKNKNHYLEFDLNSALLNFVNYFFERIDKQLTSFNFNVDLEDLAKVKGIEKYGISETALEWDEEEDFFDLPGYDASKIPKEILEKVTLEKLEKYASLKKEDVAFNLHKGIEKYQKSNRELSNFFKFLNLLRNFYKRYDYTKEKSNSVTLDLIEYTRIKFDPSYYENKDSVAKSWIEKVKDLEKK